MAVRSLALWRPEFQLVIRGPGPSEYFDKLKRLAAELGVEDRLTLEQPVLFNEIVPRANECDIGYFVHEDISPQKRFTLPNKFFEYIMAGVALCVSDLPEMSRIIKHYNNGLLVDGYSPESIAKIINSFDAEAINQFKRNSIIAAKDLNWEKESQILSEAYAQAIKAKSQEGGKACVA